MSNINAIANMKEKIKNIINSQNKSINIFSFKGYNFKGCIMLCLFLYSFFYNYGF